MKNKIYLTGLIFFAITIIGTVFKLMHYPGAGVLLTLGFSGLVLIFFPMALISSYRHEANRSYRVLYIVTYITFFICFTGMLFKIMHWPTAGIWLLVALPLPFVLFLPVFLVVTGRIEKFSIYDTVAVLLLLAFMSVFNSLLALNVAKSRLNDSALLASLYHRQAELVAGQHYGNNAGSNDVIKSANEVLQLITEAKDKFLLGTLSDNNMLANDPYKILYLDSRSLATEIMFSGEEPFLGDRLDQSINEFINVIGATKDKNVTPAQARKLLEFDYRPENGQSLSMYLFESNWTGWSLVNLGMLENNVLLIKNEILADIN